MSQFNFFFPIFPLVYHFIQTFPLINYVVINPCCCSCICSIWVNLSYLGDSEQRHLWTCLCKKWSQLNRTFHPMSIGHFPYSEVHIPLFCNNMSLPLHVRCEFLFSACLVQPGWGILGIRERWVLRRCHSTCPVAGVTGAGRVPPSAV